MYRILDVSLINNNYLLIAHIINDVASKVLACQKAKYPSCCDGGRGEATVLFQLNEVGLIGKMLGVARAQISLHIRINNARRQGNDASGVAQQGFVQGQAAAEMVQARFASAVECTGGHGASSQTRGNLQHFAFDGPTARSLQKNLREQHGGGQINGQGLVHVVCICLFERTQVSNHARIIDQSRGLKGVSLQSLQPRRKFFGYCFRVRQTGLPLKQGCAVFCGERSQRRRVATRNTQQGVVWRAKLLSHGQAHATRCASQDGELCHDMIAFGSVRSRQQLSSCNLSLISFEGDGDLWAWKMRLRQCRHTYSAAPDGVVNVLQMYTQLTHVAGNELQFPHIGVQCVLNLSRFHVLDENYRHDPSFLFTLMDKPDIAENISPFDAALCRNVGNAAQISVARDMQLAVHNRSVT
jgi:hypothetical protein